MPVDNARGLWRTAPISRGDRMTDRFGLPNASVSHETVTGEGHPRSNGDGPLTTTRDRTKGGCG